MQYSHNIQSIVAASHCNTTTNTPTGFQHFRFDERVTFICVKGRHHIVHSVTYIELLRSWSQVANQSGMKQCELAHSQK